MKNFEYQTIRIDYSANPSGAAKSLESLGKEGWELVAILPESQKAGLFFFKKSVEN